MITLTIKNKKIETQESLHIENNHLIIPEHKIYDQTIKIDVLDSSMDMFEITVGKQSNLKIILEISNQLIQSGVFNIKLNLGKNAHLKYLLVGQLRSENGLINHHFSLANDASLQLIGGFVSNKLIANIQVDLMGEGSSVNMRAIALSSDDNHQTINTHITHFAPNSYGNMTNIGIANERGKIILNGVEKIKKGMKQANAYQTLKGIILSDQASCDVNPILLIDEYDVKAGHGATVGKIETDQLYYLMSRGLSKKEAEQLIISGFLKPIFDEIDDEELKIRFTQLTLERI